MTQRWRAVVAGVRALAIEGGGIRGVAYTRPLAMLDQLLPRGLGMVNEFAGTSAGALTAMVVALGGRSKLLERVVRETCWARFASPDLVGIVTWRNALSSRYAERWIGQAINWCGWPGDVTFGTLRKQAGRDLRIFAVNESRERLQEFSAGETPDVPIARAALASMSIPFLYRAVEIDGELFSDGGLVANHPIDRLETPLERTLGLRVDSSEELEPRGPRKPARFAVGRLRRLIRLAMGHANRSHVPEEAWPRIVRIDVGTVRATNFAIGAATVEGLLLAGAEAMREWLEERGREVAL